MVENRSIEPLEDLAERIRKGPIGESAEKDFASQEPWAELIRTSAARPMGTVGPKVAENKRP